MKIVKSFESYIKEKVSKADFEKAFKNPNIVIGGEFEFISAKVVKSLPGHSEDEINDQMMDIRNRYQDADEAWSRYNQELEDARDQIKEYRSKSVDKLDKANKFFKKRVKKAMDAPYFAYMKHYHGVVGLDLVNAIYSPSTNEFYYKEPIEPHDNADAKEEAAYKVAKFNYDMYVKEIKYILKRVSDFEDKLEQKAKDMAEELAPKMHWDYLDYEGQYGPDEYETDEFGLKVYSPPMDAQSLIDDLRDSTDLKPNSKAADELFDKSPIGSDYQIGDKHNNAQNIGDEFWLVQSDSSLSPSDEGIEISSPPMNLQEFLPKCEEMFNWIEEIGETNDSCGFHIHMSIKGINLKESLNQLKLILLTDEEYIYNLFDERRLNTFTKNMKGFKGNIAPKTDKVEDEINKTLDKKELDGVTSRYYGINLTIIDENHIEFRYLGGTNYSRKWQEVKRVIGHYVHNLSAACDPTYMRKEYIQKLVRLQNKLADTFNVLKHDLINVAILSAIDLEKEDNIKLDLPTQKRIQRELQILRQKTKTEISHINNTNLFLNQSSKEGIAKKIDKDKLINSVLADIRKKYANNKEAVKYFDWLYDRVLDSKQYKNIGML